jgi:hypothetical protein
MIGPACHCNPGISGQVVLRAGMPGLSLSEPAVGHRDHLSQSRSESESGGHHRVSSEPVNITAELED